QANHRFQDAEQEYRIAQHLNGASSLSWIGLASNYLEEVEADESKRNDRLSEARDTLLHAINLEPEISLAHYLLGITYYKLAFYDQAKASLLHALELDPAFGNAHVALANVYIRTNDWSRALLQIDAYLKQNPHARDRDAVLATRSAIEGMTAGRPPSKPT